MAMNFSNATLIDDPISFRLAMLFITLSMYSKAEIELLGEIEFPISASAFVLYLVFAAFAIFDGYPVYIFISASVVCAGVGYVLTKAIGGVSRLVQRKRTPAELSVPKLPFTISLTLGFAFLVAFGVQWHSPLTAASSDPADGALTKAALFRANGYWVPLDQGGGVAHDCSQIADSDSPRISFFRFKQGHALVRTFTRSGAATKPSETTPETKLGTRKETRDDVPTTYTISGNQIAMHQQAFEDNLALIKASYDKVGDKIIDLDDFSCEQCKVSVDSVRESMTVAGLYQRGRVYGFCNGEIL